MGNAVKYSAKVAHPEVFLGMSEGPGAAFFVRDNGPGFSPEVAQAIFEPFMRLEANRGDGGHGIGLATVRRIVQKHGGTVRAESELGKGATFYFTLAPDEDCMFT